MEETYEIILTYKAHTHEESFLDGHSGLNTEDTERLKRVLQSILSDQSARDAFMLHAAAFDFEDVIGGEAPVEMFTGYPMDDYTAMKSISGNLSPEDKKYFERWDEFSLWEMLNEVFHATLTNVHIHRLKESGSTPVGPLSGLKKRHHKHK